MVSAAERRRRERAGRRQRRPRPRSAPASSDRGPAEHRDLAEALQRRPGRRRVVARPIRRSAGAPTRPSSVRPGLALPLAAPAAEIEEVERGERQGQLAPRRGLIWTSLPESSASLASARTQSDCRAVSDQATTTQRAASISRLDQHAHNRRPASAAWSHQTVSRSPRARRSTVGDPVAVDARIGDEHVRHGERSKESGTCQRAATRRHTARRSVRCGSARLSLRPARAPSARPCRPACRSARRDGRTPPRRWPGPGSASAARRRSPASPPRAPAPRPGPSATSPRAAPCRASGRAGWRPPRSPWRSRCSARGSSPSAPARADAARPAPSASDMPIRPAVRNASSELSTL